MDVQYFSAAIVENARNAAIRISFFTHFFLYFRFRTFIYLFFLMSLYNHRSWYIYIFFFNSFHRRIVSMFFSLSLSLFYVNCFFFIYYRPCRSSVKERRKKRESARERSIGFIMNFARFHVDELFVRCSFFFFYIYIDIHIRIFFVFFVRYIISVIFIHARDICSSLKIRVFFFFSFNFYPSCRRTSRWTEKMRREKDADS